MSVARRLRRHWALATVCALFLLAGALAIGDYDHVTYDGGIQRAIGNATLDYLAGDGERAFGQLVAASDRYYGAVVEAPLALLDRALGRDGERVQHIPMHLFFLFGGVCCYLLVYRLFNSRLLALLAAVLFLLHPRLYAHSFFNSKDIPFLAAFMIALYLMHRAFRRETLGAFILCGVGVGLLVNLRVMGVVLFAAVLALRALDLAFAGKHKGGGGVRSWRATAGSAGAFALAAMLTYHASLPALWTDPFGRFAELLETLSTHPYVAFNLFRGELLYSRDGPSLDYVPVWIAITTPPATLALAAMGAVALAWRGIRHPRDLLRNGPTRFGLLLALLPVAVTVAIVVLGSNVYETWRQLFFLYAPLSLLAVFGLHALLRAWRGRWPRAGAYALAGAAIAVTLVSMVRIHPHERLYFTLLTDRAAPERLADRYDLDPGGVSLSHRNLVRNVLDDHPAATLRGFRYTFVEDVIPLDEWRRITAPIAFRSGDGAFYRFPHFPRACPYDAPGTYAVRVYGATLDCAVDAEAWFGGLRREARAAEPLARSRFAAHRVGGFMVYLRDGCSRGDTATRFFLRVYPADPADLPDYLRDFPGPHAAYGFEKRDFDFGRYGASIDGNCVAAVPLPDHPIARIETGQYTPDWAQAARRAVAGAAPVARSYFDVWLDADARTLTWVREACSAEDEAARFRLHIHASDAGDLPPWRAEHGFDNLNFDFAEHGVRLRDGACVAVAPLPAWPIANIHTGQFLREGDGAGTAWSARFAFSPPEVDPSALAGEPLARAVFNVWRDGDALVYVKDGCTEADAAARFALHFYPVDPADLSAASREHGFENRDFHLWEYGGLADGDRCIAVATLPDYPVASVRTGQYHADGALWEARFPLMPGEIDAVLAHEPLARAVFDVWRDGDTLIYVRDGCTGDDADAAFFLHLYPVDEADLPEAARERGFENRDFLPWQRGGRADGRCVAMTALPHYPIASVRTGQYNATGELWAARFPLMRGEIDAVLAREPLARAAFDIWRDGDALVYVRDGCTEEEADAAFFLHVYPVDADDLPEAAREHGFGNRDFLLWQRGGRAEGRCVAMTALPDYPIARVETGQYDDAGRRWAAEFAPPE